MVSETNKRMLKELKVEIAKHKVVGIADLNKLPAKQMLDIRGSLRGRASIRMAKKRVIALALKESGLDDLAESGATMPALLFSNENPFKLAMLIAASKSSAPAKPGDTLDKDITVPAGPTSVAAGPAIGDFQKLKIQVGVEGGKIAVKKDTVVAKKGDKVTAPLAGLLQKLGITPVEIGLNLLAVCEAGTIYTKDVLFVPAEHYLAQIMAAHSNAFSLSIAAGFVTKDNAAFLLSKAHAEATSLALKAGFVTDETLAPLLARGVAEAELLKTKIPDTKTADEKEGAG